VEKDTLFVTAQFMHPTMLHIDMDTIDYAAINSRSKLMCPQPYRELFGVRRWLARTFDTRWPLD
jgi:hypothetical protein